MAAVALPSIISLTLTATQTVSRTQLSARKKKLLYVRLRGAISLSVMVYLETFLWTSRAMLRMSGRDDEYRPVLICA